ncbi:MAG: carbon-nitrogen hydrolase family protein [Campylobacterales bacterium]
MTSKASFPLAAIQMKTTPRFDENVTTLTDALLATPEQALVVAPELCLTGFAYDRMDDAAAFSSDALYQLQEIVGSRLLCLTTIEKSPSGYLNTAYLITQEAIRPIQSKHALFPLGHEDDHFLVGSKELIRLHELNGLRIGVLICYELRFLDLWERLRGADIILVPAFWGKERKNHFITLTAALALQLQCHVVAACSCNDDMAGYSSIIDPWGNGVSLEGKCGQIATMYDSHITDLTRRALPIL